MIQPNELRINNWVYVGDLLGQINADSFKSTKEFDPIPLMPKILIDAGFEYGKSDGISSFEEGESDPKGITHYWDKDIKRTDHVDGHSVTIVKWGEQEYFTFQLERGLYRQQIMYVHQLQNLWHSLAGEELVINL
jgi:hypothetical protein